MYKSPPNPQLGDLVFQYGDEIEVLWKNDDEEWWRGRMTKAGTIKHFLGAAWPFVISEMANIAFTPRSFKH